MTYNCSLVSGNFVDSYGFSTSFTDPMDCSLPGPSAYGDSPGKNTGMGCHALLQGIFPTQRLNSGLPHLQADSLLSEPRGKPNLEGITF